MAVDVLNKTNIVGVIASDEDARVAWGNPTIADVFEWRLDYCMSPETVTRVMEIMSFRPVIITVRDHREGGKQEWDAATRIALYKKYMHLACFIDVEASTAHEMTEVIELAQREGVGVIISQHVFDGLWTPSQTTVWAQVCTRVKGDIFKVALLPDSLAEYGEFLACVGILKSNMYPIRVTSMAIGTQYGKISRIVAALDGAVLVYGYLNKAPVEGQFQVQELKMLLTSFTSVPANAS